MCVWVCECLTVSVAIINTLWVQFFRQQLSAMYLQRLSALSECRKTRQIKAKAKTKKAKKKQLVFKMKWLCLPLSELSNFQKNAPFK